MLKILILIVLSTLVGAFMFKPPFIINFVESVVGKVRSVALKLTYPKYFHNDPSGYQALPFEDVLNDTSSLLDRTAPKWTVWSTYKNEKRPTYILLLNNYDLNKPSLIYHHGAGSTDPIRDFNIIYGEDFTSNYNVFIVHAQYHTTKNEYLNKSVDSFLHHQQTFAGSVLAYEEIVKYHRSLSKSPIIATGSSMGGVVSSLHAFYFGSADIYFPLVAYPNVGEIFLGKAYKTAVADWDGKKSNVSYLNSFAIKNIDPSLTKKVYPILGSEDKIVPFLKSYEFWNSNGFTVKAFPYGHFTPGVARHDIRKYIREKLVEISQ